MFVGHYGLSYAAKALDPAIPLELLFLTTQAPDILWVALNLLGVEQTEIDPTLPTTPFILTSNHPYSHSLVAALAQSVAVYVATRALRSGTAQERSKSALLSSATTLSHWLLDLVVHQRDLPIWDNAYKVGFGLWRWRTAAFVVESLLLLGGLSLYLRSTAAESSVEGKYGMSLFAGVLLLLQAVATFGPPPRTTKAPLISSLVSYVALTGGAAWLSRKRQ